MSRGANDRAPAHYEQEERSRNSLFYPPRPSSSRSPSSGEMRPSAIMRRMASRSWSRSGAELPEFGGGVLCAPVDRSGRADWFGMGGIPGGTGGVGGVGGLGEGGRGGVGGADMCRLLMARSTASIALEMPSL